MINDIMRKFPKMTVSDNLLNDPLKDGIYISTPQATIHRMLINMSDRFNGSKNQLWGNHIRLVQTPNKMETYAFAYETCRLLQ